MNTTFPLSGIIFCRVSNFSIQLMFVLRHSRKLITFLHMNRTKVFGQSKSFLVNRNNFCPYEQALSITCFHKYSIMYTTVRCLTKILYLFLKSQLWPLFGGKLVKPHKSKLFYVPQVGLTTNVLLRYITEQKETANQTLYCIVSANCQGCDNQPVLIQAKLHVKYPYFLKSYTNELI